MPKLNNPTIRITADEGKTVVEGQVESFSIDHEDKLDTGMFGVYEYTLRFRPVHDKYFTVTKRTQSVTYTARTTAQDNTVEALEKARVAAGVPKNAKVRMERNPLQVPVEAPLDRAVPVKVEFIWEETQ